MKSHTKRTSGFILALLLALVSCGDDQQPGRDGDPTPTPRMEPDASSITDGGTGNPDEDMAVAQPDGGTSDDGGNDGPQAPRRWPAENRLTQDVDTDLAVVLESQNLEGACDAYRNGQTDELTTLRCGKWMFLYETFGTVGIPKPLLDFNQRYFADSYFGDGFSELGFIPDPATQNRMPLGLAPTTAKLGSVETSAFTCAACHFGKMEDGRYAVGYGNLELDYGRFVATLGAPLQMAFNDNSADVHPDIRAELAEPIRQAKEDSSFTTEAAAVGIQLLGAGQDSGIDVAMQGQFMQLKTGTMDFLTPPLIDDGVWTVSRIISLWNLPSEQQRMDAGMPNEMLSWAASAHTLQDFLSGFVAIGVSESETWDEEALRPLELYIRSLRTPEASAPRNQTLVEHGADVFVESGCIDCHNGPSGESNEVFSFDEIGTDAQYAQIFWPEGQAEPCCDIPAEVLTGGVKAPRFTGLENQTRFLHNGSVESLAALLCLEPRATDDALGQSSGGHEYGCELSQEDRASLIEYLQSL